MLFNLGQELAPEKHGHGGGTATKDAYHMIFDGLDGLLGHVLVVIVGGNELIRHCSEFNLSLSLIVKNLMPWCNAALGHSCEGTPTGKDKFAFAVVSETFNPRGIRVNMVENHDIPVAKAGDDWETSHLVRIEGVMQIHNPDKDIMGHGKWGHCSCHGCLGWINLWDNS